MPYTNPWVEGNPLDTSPANQLGDVIRDLKTDLRERLALPGSFSPVPDPESVWVGLTYFDQTNGRLLRWNGSVWTVVSMNLKLVDSNAYSIVSPGLGSLGDISINGGLVPTGALIEFQGSCVITGTTAGADMSQIQLTNGSSGAGIMINGPNAPGTFHYYGSIYVLSQTSQLFQAVVVPDAGTPTVARGTLSENMAVLQRLIFQRRNIGGPNGDLAVDSRFLSLRIFY